MKVDCLVKGAAERPDSGHEVHPVPAEFQRSCGDSGDSGRLDGLTNICRIRSSFGKLITQAPCLFHSASVSVGDIRPSSFVEAGAGAGAGAGDEGGLSGTGVDGFIGWGVWLSNCFGFWFYEGR